MQNMETNNVPPPQKKKKLKNGEWYMKEDIISDFVLV